LILLALFVMPLLLFRIVLKNWHFPIDLLLMEDIIAGLGFRFFVLELLILLLDVGRYPLKSDKMFRSWVND
jgi:hypothetical protein